MGLKGVFWRIEDSLEIFEVLGRGLIFCIFRVSIIGWGWGIILGNLGRYVWGYLRGEVKFKEKMNVLEMLFVLVCVVFVR